MDSDAKPIVEAPPLLRVVQRFLSSSVGMKVMMSLTGIVLWGFIMAHLAGNLLIFAGQDAFNHYAAALKSNPALLWAVRSALIVAFPVHILTAIRTSQLNKAARPVPYAFANNTPIRPASQWAIWSGLGLLAFLLMHLAQFTWHVGPWQNPPTNMDGTVDAYTMAVTAFADAKISLIYIIGQLLLAGHLGAGIYGVFQHLGVWGRSWTPFAKKLGDAIGYGVAGAFITIPIAVLAGMVHP
jgi:succinate dehydrogenase / fumarate reductase cytochrome b subunit